MPQRLQCPSRPSSRCTDDIAFANCGEELFLERDAPRSDALDADVIHHQRPNDFGDWLFGQQDATKTVLADQSSCSKQPADNVPIAPPAHAESNRRRHPPELGRIELLHDPAVDEHEDAIAGKFNLREHVAAQEHRCTVARHLADEAPKVGDAHDIESVGWLVQDKHGRSLHDGLCERQALSHTKGVLGYRATVVRVQAATNQGRPHSLSICAPANRGEERQIPIGVHVFHESRTLRNEPQHNFGVPWCGSVQPDRPLRWERETGQQSDEGGLASAVWADYSDDLRTRDRERHVGQDCAMPDDLGNGLDPHQLVRHRTSFRTPTAAARPIEATADPAQRTSEWIMGGPELRDARFEIGDHC